MALTSGTRLGPYEVISALGAGGMGEVYRARDTKLDRDVALKILPEAFTSDPERLARFEREAKVLASLNHPNIAAIHGLEESGTIHALVMELVEGEDLAQRLRRGPVPLDEALPIATQIADALEAAHEQGIVHRDLKPANIKVRPDGTVKVLDFGLAKAMDSVAGGSAGAARGFSPGDADSPTLTSPATQLGVILGTAAYMSPEQARGKPVDKRTDIWAFGCVLYEMLTGRRAFGGDDVTTTIAEVVKSEPDLSALPSDCPPPIGTTLRGCLVKDPKARIRDIGDVRLALEGAFETTGSGAASSRRERLHFWQRPMAVITAMLASLSLGGVAVWSLNRPAPPPPAPITRFPILLAADQTFSGPGDPVVAISPDGSRIVYQADGSLWVRPVDQLVVTRVRGTEGGSSGPFFSPDGEWIGFLADGQLKKVSVASGAPMTIATVASNPRAPSWGADDRILYGQPDGIWQVAGTGGAPTRLIPLEDDERILRPQMLPGGEWVLFTVLSAGETSWDEARIVAQSVTTRERVVLIDRATDGRYVPTGHLAYVSNGVLFAVPFDAAVRQVTGGAVPLIEGVWQTRLPSNGAAQFSVSASGSLVYVPRSARAESLRLTWVGRDGRNVTVPDQPPRAYGHPRVSPDGTRVAIDITERENTDVWIWHLTGETLTQLTFHDGVDDFPLWTPDGTKVVFASDREGGGLFWKAADGTGRVERLKEGMAQPYAWTSDGKLVFQQDQDIGALAVDGQRSVEMLLDSDVTELSPSLSPDGRWLAFHSDATGSSLVIVRPYPDLDGGQWRISPRFGRHPLWSPDGRELFYRGPGDRELMVARIETEPGFRSSTPEPLLDISGFSMSYGRQYDIAPDGSRFIFLQPESPGDVSSTASFGALIVVLNWHQELLERVPLP